MDLVSDRLVLSGRGGELACDATNTRGHGREPSVTVISSQDKITTFSPEMAGYVRRFAVEDEKDFFKHQFDQGPGSKIRWVC